MIRAMKNVVLTAFVKSKVKEYCGDTCSVDSVSAENGRVSAVVRLAGEDEPLVVEAADVSFDGKNISVRHVSSSKEWVEMLLNIHLSGKKLKVPVLARAVVNTLIK